MNSGLFGARRDLGTLEPAPQRPKPSPLAQARKCLADGRQLPYSAAAARYLEGLLILAIDARKDDVVE